MKIWKRVILGVVFSFVAFFTCLGYAALTDQLSITGTVTATMPKDIFITEIIPGSDTFKASFDLREITIENAPADTTITFAVTVYNNSGARKVCTGWNTSLGTINNYTAALTGDEEQDKKNIIAFAQRDNEDDPYYHAANALVVEDQEKVTFYVKYKTEVEGPVVIDYNFQDFIYKIAYVHNSVDLDTRYVYNNAAVVYTENSTAAEDAEKAMRDMGENAEFGYWMDAGHTERSSIDPDYLEEAGYPTEIVLYPKFNNPFTAMFVNQDGSLLAWSFFNNTSTSKYYYANEDTVKKAEADARAALPDLGDEYVFDYWIVKGDGINETYDINKFASYKNDVTIYPVYQYNGDVQLIPVDNHNDGDTDFYQVGGYRDPSGQALVEIPDSFNGKKVEGINANAFSSYAGVHSIVIPTTVTNIGENAFASGNTFGSGQQITIYYKGTKTQWETLTQNNPGWDKGIGTGSRVFFLNAQGKVNTQEGYLEVVGEGGILGWGTTYSWKEKTDVASVATQYTGYCNCSNTTEGDTAHTYVDANGNVMGRNEAGTPVNASGTVIEYKRKNIFSSYKLTTDHNDTYYRYRPDRQYWEGVTISS
jgi:hypothetical protein